MLIRGGIPAVVLTLQMWKSARSFASSVITNPRLTRFVLQSPTQVELEFDDGKKFILSAEFLRVQSPAADSKIRTVKGEKILSGRQHVGIMSAETVGNYGIRVTFDDLHNTGIYTWDYLYNLGNNKFALMKDYIRTLKKYNLSRDPRKR